MADKVNRPFAVFDIDGTLIRWQLYHALNDALARKKLIDEKGFNKVRKARMNWKRRSYELSYHDYEQQLISLFEQELAGLKVSDLENAAQEVFDEYKDQVYTFTRDLIANLKKKNYLIFAISASPNIIVEKLADYYRFDDFVASTYSAMNGIYTGETNITIGKKAEILNNLIVKNQATKKGSVAVGDSEGDSAMLELVDKAIAFNPNKQLLDYSKDKHWDIVVERKNVIYKLSFVNGAYILE
ncbi:MAG: HAD family hydrolase [Candidatus Saccharimonadales bacterium]